MRLYNKHCSKRHSCGITDQAAWRSSDMIWTRLRMLPWMPVLKSVSIYAMIIRCRWRQRLMQRFVNQTFKSMHIDVVGNEHHTYVSLPWENKKAGPIFSEDRSRWEEGKRREHNHLRRMWTYRWKIPLLSVRKPGTEMPLPETDWASTNLPKTEPGLMLIRKQYLLARVDGWTAGAVLKVNK